MELLESLQWRYATKKMNGEKIPTDKLNTILEATKLAPSSYGLTPYQVIVVEDQELKQQLQGACYGQTQLVDSSAVLVFATWENISEVGVNAYMNEIATQRGISVDMLSDFSNMLNGSIKGMTEEQKQTWAQKQTYIGLGFALVAAATEGVDSTPMEGFAPQQVDEILGLKDLGLKSSVILTLGYRDAENDYLASLKKVRWNDDKFFIRK
jgi:nitroreductase/dihydropteridine reductase